MDKRKKQKVIKKRGPPPTTRGLPSSARRKCTSPAPTVPFEPSHRILLVGEGDFSFAHSLLEHHGCSCMIATCLDTRSVLLKKYPQAEAHIDALLAAADDKEEVKVLYGVDATKLGGKEVKKGGFDRIVFNFPHVGGLTKDVNRQVRYNQELLVGFFKSATPILTPGGTIVVTVFEGEPYTLWNVRDLARHVGLQVGMSFKFQADAYSGYEHARTLGNIKGGGGWKGENRPARTYLFEVKDREEDRIARKKRKRAADDDDGDDDN